MSRYQRVGDFLVTKGIITEAQRDEALVVQKKTENRFGEVLVSLGMVTEDQIVACLAEQYDLPTANMSETQPTQTALRLVSPTFALSRLILPVLVTEYEFHCVIADPLDIEGTDYLSKALGKRLIISLAGTTELYRAITKNYAVPAVVSNATPPPLLTEAQTTSPSEKPQAAPKKPRVARAPKVDAQPDRKDLLAVIAGTGTDSLWDTYGD